MDKTLCSAWMANRADIVLAFREREALSASWAKQKGIPPYAGKPLVMIACWLADEVLSMTPAERSAAVERYSGVALTLVLSRNQVEILVDAGFNVDRIEAVTFGFDPGQFPLADVARWRGIVSDGADRGRDFPTLLSAMEGSGLQLDLYTSAGHLEGTRLPPEVQFRGKVPFERYREVVATASIVTIPTHVRAYSTGQTVALEAAGTGACLVLTDTPVMREYFTDETAMFAAPGDVEGWRVALRLLHADPQRRLRLGANAAGLAAERFTYDEMWRQVDTIFRRRRWTRGGADR